MCVSVSCVGSTYLYAVSIVCVCMYTCKDTYVYIYICIYTQIYVYLQNIYNHLYIYIYLDVCMCKFYIYIIYIHSSIHIYNAKTSVGSLTSFTKSQALPVRPLPVIQHHILDQKPTPLAYDWVSHFGHSPGTTSKHIGHLKVPWCCNIHRNWGHENVCLVRSSSDSRGDS